MRRAILLGFVWALGAGAATAQPSERFFGCSRNQPSAERGFLGLDVIGLTGDAEQKLVCFIEVLPSLGRTIGVVSGLDQDARLVGIDYRPATGQLYGLGDAGGVYTLNEDTAAATLQSRLNVALSGTTFGVDFNPTVDRLRVVSDNGQNLRVDVVTGTTTVDAALNTPPTAGATLGVTAVAYTNNDASAATATTLFDINTVADTVAIQAPPNNGSLNATGTLRVDAGTDAGFDIYSRLEDGVTKEVAAIASLTVGGRQRLYRVDLLTGEATLRGTFRLAQPVVDVAIPTQQ